MKISEVLTEKDKQIVNELCKQLGSNYTEAEIVWKNLFREFSWLY